ncbi:hypothetical protein [Klebsiella grimontii]|uniref:hypothetical protein n=1 Tax=Klebsiella grimontii TaxID=2058152 RepID=UPI001E06DBD6|nr:hypothetical protein [Klebsiella grimontii]EGT0066762.1 hypothetical protein [Klebsiella michiganensis]WDI68750.1 hypothetical protein PU992_20740 [Klebsiella grimontii]
MQQQVGLQEAFDGLVERIKKLEEHVVINRIRDDISQNFFLIHVLHNSSAQALKDAWDKLLSSGYESKLIEQYKSIDATVSALVEKTIKDAIGNWSNFIELAVKAETARNQSKV